ncbi:MAG: ABC transporter permease [Trueperaceae bacterium]|nr:ABC transporter permease [Trueperaceae bacterium]
MYALQQAMRAVRANWVASVSTIATMILSLTVLAGFSLLTLNLNAWLSRLQSELELSAYLNDSADEAVLIDTIQSWSEIRSVDFIPKESAINDLGRDFPSISVATDLVGNPLPDRLDMRVVDPRFVSTVSAKLQGLAGVTEVQDGSDTAETFVAINESVQVIGSILIIVLLTSSLFAIVNSIRAAITARAREIEVMRLVGATREFIRAPFLIEGFLLGLISAGVALALIIPGYQFVLYRLSDRLQFLPLVRDLWLLIRVTGLLFALALLVGIVGSAISISQHLREEV